MDYRDTADPDLRAAYEAGKGDRDERLKVLAAEKARLRAALEELYATTHAFIDAHGYLETDQDAEVNGALGRAFDVLHPKRAG